jgi:hypothetical protein
MTASRQRAAGPALLAGFLVSLFAGGWSTSAGASDLSWSGPAECRESEQLLFQVERALGAPLADTGHVHLQVHIARVVPDARALLRIASAEPTAPDASLKERLLVAPDCATLVDTLAVAIALAVEAAVPAPEPAWTSPPPVTSHTVAATSLPLVSDVAPGPPPKPEPTGLQPGVTALLVADSGSLPGPALGAALGARLAGASWHLELLGTLWFEQHAELRPSRLPGAGADVNLATAGVLACVDPLAAGARVLGVSLCAGWEMGRLSGMGSGVNRPREARALWLAPSLQLALAYRIPATRLSLNALAGGALPLDRDEFVLEGLGTVHQPASLAVRGAIGLSIALE